MWLLAWRNMFRRGPRTLMCGVVLGLSSFIIVISVNFSVSIRDSLQRAVTESYTGDLQIASTGFDAGLDPTSNSINIPNPIRSILSLEQQLDNDKRIKAWTKRSQCVAIIHAKELSTPVILLGVIPDKEQDITKKIKIDKGFYPEQGTNEVVISKKLAGKLRLNKGDQISAFTITKEGFPSGINLEITGLYTVDGPGVFGDVLAITTIHAIADILEMERGQFHSYCIILNDTGIEQDIVSDIKSWLPSGKAPNVFKIYLWRDLAGLAGNAIYITKIMTGIINSVIIFTIILVIFTIFSMNMWERVKETGILKIVGAGAGHVIKLFLIEAVYMGFVFGLSGIIISSILIIFGQKYGIPAFTSAMEMGFGGKVLYLSSLGTLPFKALLITTGISILGAFPNALMLSKVDPVKALRHR